MRNITYVCKKNFPTLNLVTGQKFVVKSNTEQAAFFDRMPEYFTKMLSDTDCWHIGDAIVYSGRATNMTHPGRNRNTLGRGEYIKNVLGHIDALHIHPNNPEMCNLRFKTLGGIEYNVENISIIIEECVSDNTRLKPNIVKAEEYWFINSEGTICRAMAGKDENADNWRKVSGNYFATHADITAAKEAILLKGCVIN